MINKLHFLKGFVKYFFNSRISFFALVSSTNSMGKYVAVYRGAKIKKTEIGNYSYISAHTVVENASIGKFCSIADHCRIGLANHTLHHLSTSPVFTLAKNAAKTQWIKESIDVVSSKKVIIGNDVWIGSHAIVLGGVKIGDGAVIGAGAVVTKDVPPYAVVGGVPAKVLKYRFSQNVIDRLLSIKWWNIPENNLQKNISLFQKEDVREDIIDKLQIMQ